MDLRAVDVNRKKSLVNRVKSLYYTSFPKEEIVPWWIARLYSHRKDMDMLAWLDGDTFCGFTASVKVDGMYFVYFLAVAPELHSRGYGSAILQALQRMYSCVCLNIEPLDEDAPNYSQRRRRFAFYQKNGFYDTGYYVWEVGGKFRVLSTEPVLDVPQYKQVFRKLTFGIWNVRMEK